MASRILLGKRGTDYGLWVSKPGFNVTTTALDNMLFGMEKLAQIAQSGTVTLPSGAGTSVTITHTLGFRPAVVIRDDWSDLGSSYLKISTTTTTVKLIKDISAAIVVNYLIYNVAWR